MFTGLLSTLGIIWDLTESDFWTFVIPDTLFGIFGALSGQVLTDASSAATLKILQRFPLVLVYTWLNLVIFDLANQRDSSAEDAINKPHRPIPSGRLNSLQMRRLLLISIPSVLVVSFMLEVWQETALLIALTWMYNDLAGGDESFIIRNLIIAVAFGLYNYGALRVACGTNSAPTVEGHRWAALISGVIFSTMQVQDLKDQKGDKVRSRSTAPLVLGDAIARWTIVVPVIMWSFVCPYFLKVGIWGYLLPVGTGLLIAIRTLLYRDSKEDNFTWEIWAGWLIILYMLPLVKNYDAF